MNMEVSNKELQELLNAYMKRLDKMDKERDKMIKKINDLNNNVKTLNKEIDDLYYQLGGETQIEFKGDGWTEEELEHVKRITHLIENKEVDFLDDDEFKVLIHSVVGES